MQKTPLIFPAKSLQPAAIAYILVIGPIIWGMQPKVVRSLRPVILVDDQELARVVRRASSIPPLYEAAAIAAGLFFGFLLMSGLPNLGDRWPTYVAVATEYVMFGLLGWLGFMAIAQTRVVNNLLRLPMRIDPLDIFRSKPSAGRLSQEVNALAIFEQHLYEASSWHYNPSILRTLIFGVLVPISTVLAHRVFEVTIR